MTLNEVYYEINRRLSQYLTAQGVNNTPLYQSGVDPAMLHAAAPSTEKAALNYLQTSITNIQTQSWTSRRAGTRTLFDFQLAFYTAKTDELKNRAALFYPFEIAKNAMSDVDVALLRGVATVMSTSATQEFAEIAGISSPRAVVIYRMIAVTSYVATVSDATLSTDLTAAIVLEDL